jgi:radical SAM protein with 4Fe4S-binding SPASM domain
VVAAIEACVDGGLPVAVNTTVNRLNQRSLRDLRDFIRDKGAFSMQIQLATPSGNMDSHRDLVVDPADLVWLVPDIAALCRQNTSKFFAVGADDVGYYGMPEQGLRDNGGELPFWIGCRAGCQVVGIESSGNVKGCLSLPSSMHGEGRFVEGNLRDKSLAELWNADEAFAYNRKYSEASLTGFCRVCRYRDFCRGGCTWTVYCNTLQGGEGNPFCFYFQAVKQRRFDLLNEDPTPPELDFFASGPASPVTPPVDPVDARALFALAQTATTACRFEEAHRLLTKALQLAPDELAILDLAGFVCFSLRDFVAAEQHNRVALAKQPDHAFAHNGLGLSLAKQGRLDEGRAAIERAIALAPGWYEPYHDLAVVLAEAGLRDQAATMLDRGAAAIPQSAAEFARVKAVLVR